ncbi:hypothetical protein ACFFOS_22460 [Nocardioides kongjuensis]|uniref:hypothetical protein n=1 Tax=Nocardioides kongjuensis TaxID=349522 RepID=UPI0035ED0C3D
MTRSRAEMLVPAGTVPVIARSMPRSAPSAVLPSSSAASTGSSTAPTTWSVSSWATCSSDVANSTASSGRPISMRDTTVCSRLADSWFCERSDSVRRRTTSSSPVTERSSVWSRSVTTDPTSRPSQRAGAADTTSIRSPAR